MSADRSNDKYQDLVRALEDGRLSRREFLRRTGALGVGATAASVTGVSAAAAPRAQADVDEIRIGLLFPTTGSMAVLGTHQGDAAKMAMDYANENGGVSGVPITYFEADAQSDPAVGATEAQRLIDQHDVHVIIGSYSSGIADAASNVAERNGVIYWEVGAVAVELVQKGYQYFFRTIGDAATYAQADIEFLMDYYANAIGMPAEEIRIAVANENGPFGASVAAALEELIAQNGLNLVANESFSDRATDLTPLILRLQEAEPDIVFIVPIVASGLLFWEQARTQGFNVPGIIGSAGFSSPSFVERFGAEGVEGVLDVEAPAVAHMDPAGLAPEIAELHQRFVQDFQEQYGEPPLVHAGDGFGGTWVLVNDVLPRAINDFGGVDAEAIRQAANETDIPEGGTIQGFGVRFIPTGEPNAGNNERGRSYIMQWKGGELQVVWPSELAIAEPTVPMPTWEERG